MKKQVLFLILFLVVFFSLGLISILDSTYATPTIAEAVDNNNLTWTTGGDANWTGETNQTSDGIDAAQSGQIGNNQQSWVKTNVTGPGTLKFRWKVSSEGNYDYLKFYVDSNKINEISGQKDWAIFSYQITNSNNHQLTWKYTKDTSTSYGYDCGWLDHVEWIPGFPDLISTSLYSKQTFTNTNITIVDTVKNQGNQSASAFDIAYNLYKSSTICNNTYEQSRPNIYGSKIVWQDNRKGNWDIYMKDLTSGQETQITTNSFDQCYPKIYGDSIVFQDNQKGNWDIFMYNITSKITTPICTALGNQTWPSLQGNKIVWIDNSADDYGEIDLYNLSNKTTKRITTIDDRGHISSPVVYGNWVAWIYNTAYDTLGGRIYSGFEVLNLENGSKYITKYYDQAGYVQSLSIYGNNLAYIECGTNTEIEPTSNGYITHCYFDLFMKNLATGAVTRITNDKASQHYVSTYGDNIVWQDWKNSLGDIYLYKISKGIKIRVYKNPKNEDIFSSLYGDNIVWNDSRNGNSDIFMSTIAYLGKRSLPGLVKGASNTSTNTFGIPSSLPDGKYYLRATVDPNDKVLETSEGNNFITSSQTITIDRIMPKITSIIPTNGATNIARNKIINITFSEAVKWGNNFIEIKANGTTISTTAYTLSLSSDGKTLTIKPVAGTLWKANTTYTVVLHTGCVKDYAGNNLALATRSFKTGST